MSLDANRPPHGWSSRRENGPLLGDEMLCSLLLHPDMTEAQASSRAAHRRQLRVSLTVAAMSGMVLTPAVSLADDAPKPIVTATCQISAELPDGTPSGLLEDGRVCVLPNPATPAGDPPTPGKEPPAPSETPPPVPIVSTPPVPIVSTPPEPDLVSAPDPASVAVPSANGSAAAGEAAPAPAPPAASADTAVEQPHKGAPAQVTPSPRLTRPLADKQLPEADARARPHSAHRRRHAHAVRHHQTRQATAEAPAAAAAPLPGTLRGTLPAPFYVTDEPVIPRFLIRLYKQAGRHYRIPWPILAAINEIETDFGRNVAVSSAGATGWMQFMPSTWSVYGVDADHNGVKDPDNPRDAIFAAARYLKASGAKHDMRRAIFAYNHAGWYVDSILLRAERIAVHQGARNHRLSRLFHAGERRLERQVLADPRITLYECGRQDVAAHKIDRRILILLRFLAWSGLHPTVTSLECGHGRYTTSGNISEHSTGSAVDIAAINGVPIFGHQGSGSVTEATIRELLTLRGAMEPHQIISLMTFPEADNTLAMSDHADHIHVGFRPLEPIAHAAPRPLEPITHSGTRASAR